MYKLVVRCYGGAPDTDNDVSDYWYTNCASDQKWIDLYDLMFEPFKDKGQGITYDSAYMGNITAQTSCNEWKINMVGII